MSDEPKRRDEQQKRQREAQRTLDQVERDSTTFASSSLAQQAQRTRDHFAAADAVGAGDGGATDPIELWGRRVGRALSLVACIALAIYLTLTYLR
jgi:hypothetical protein